MTAPRNWLGVVLLLILALRFIWPPVDAGRRDFVLELTAAGPVAGAMQLYFQRDPSPGFSEEESVVLELQTSGPRVYRFALPSGTYRALRFDPLPHGPGVVQVSAARIVDRRTGAARAELPVSTWTIGQNIGRVTDEAGVLHIAVADDQLDPTMRIPLPEGTLTLRRPIAARMWATLLVVVGALGAVWRRPRVSASPRLAALVRSWFAAPCAAVEHGLQAHLPRERFPLDRFALTFLALVLGGGLVAAACGFHGSSSTMRRASGLPEGDWAPLVGMPQNIRWDEWNVHTPLVLYQANRADRFAVEPSLIGPQKTTLIGNAPVWHWTAIFRPQYWAFFVLPTATAFAAYWQAKSVVLLCGTFLLFLLLTRSSRLAAFGAAWFYLSAFTQWAFSWPAMLPEMIGLACLAAVAVCLMFVATSRRALAVLGGVFVFAGTNFVLCAYPPFQVPLAWAVGGMALAWLLDLKVARAEATTTPVRWARGAATLGLSVTGVAAIASLFLREIHPVIAITARTIYPGNRSLPGGGVSWEQLASAFLDPIKTDAWNPPQYQNICEGSGYFWFGVVSLVLAGPVLRAARGTAGRSLYFALFVPLLLLGTWATVEIPATAGRWLLLDKVQSTRVLPALGLVNIAITVTFLRLGREPGPGWRISCSARRRLVLLLVAFSGAWLLLWQMNRSIDDFFSAGHLALAAAWVGAGTVALACVARQNFAALVLAPLVWSSVLINPIDRGLAIYDRSALRDFVDTHGCRDGGWMVVSDHAHAATYFAALGLDVFNVQHFVPRLDVWRRFDPAGRKTSFYNGAGMTLVRALPPGSAAEIGACEGAPLGPPVFRRLQVDPADPRLRAIGIRYLAHQGTADATLFPPDQFEPLHAAPIDGFTLYRLRAP